MRSFSQGAKISREMALTMTPVPELSRHLHQGADGIWSFSLPPFRANSLLIVP